MGSIFYIKQRPKALPDTVLAGIEKANSASDDKKTPRRTAQGRKNVLPHCFTFTLQQKPHEATDPYTGTCHVSNRLLSRYNGRFPLHLLAASVYTVPRSAHNSQNELGALNRFCLAPTGSSLEALGALLFFAQTSFNIYYVANYFISILFICQVPFFSFYAIFREYSENTSQNHRINIKIVKKACILTELLL